MNGTTIDKIYNLIAGLCKEFNYDSRTTEIMTDKIVFAARGLHAANGSGIAFVDRIKEQMQEEGLPEPESYEVHNCNGKVKDLPLLAKRAIKTWDNLGMYVNKGDYPEIIMLTYTYPNRPVMAPPEIISKIKSYWMQIDYELFGLPKRPRWCTGVAVHKVCVPRKYAVGEEVRPSHILLHTPIPRSGLKGSKKKKSNFRYYFIGSYRTMADIGNFRLLRVDEKGNQRCVSSGCIYKVSHDEQEVT